MAQFKNAYEYLLQLQPESKAQGRKAKPLLDSVTPLPQNLQINLGDNPFAELHSSQIIEELVPEEHYKQSTQEMSGSKFNSEYRTVISKPESTKSYQSGNRNLLSMLELQSDQEEEYYVTLKVRGFPKQQTLEILRMVGEVQEIKKHIQQQSCQAYQTQQSAVIQPQQFATIPSLQIPTFQKQSFLQKKTQDSSREHSLEKAGGVFLKPQLLQKRLSPFQLKEKVNQLDQGQASKKTSFHIFSKNEKK